MLGNLLSTTAMKVAAGIILALALLAGVQTLRLSWVRAELADERAERALIVAQAVQQARKADAAGIATAEAGKALRGAEIERGREAAKDGPDPWRQATEAMR